MTSPNCGRDDALAHPSRAGLFAALTELRRVAKTAELAERLELHPNGVRIHLERLEEAGLVSRVRVQGPRGRPAHAWMVAPTPGPEVRRHAHIETLRDGSQGRSTHVG